MMNNDGAAFATRTATDLPYEVRRERTETVMADGTRIAVTLWLPVREDPCGVVLEAIPYRKDDVSVIDDETRFPYFAGHGVACARIDLRGSGSSTGVLMDEYTPTEQRDIVEVVEWLAAQEWCNGSVGMIGISWSGFNALQVAALRPPALKAIITVSSADDRYDNDVHYLGGVPLAFYMNLWGSALHTFNMRPPIPELMGPDWRDEWATRLAANTDMTSLWLSHPYRDSYWRQGSVCEDYSAIEIPVLAVGGWADNYTDTVLRLIDRLPGVAKGLIGPWGHTWPERPEPGPGMDFLHHCMRWWDRWLHGEPTGVEDDPTLSFYLQDYVMSAEDLAHRPGRWLGVDDRASAVTETMLGLGEDGRLGGSAPEGTMLDYTGSLVVGMQARHPLPMGVATDLPPIQDDDDARSLVFETDPLESPLSMLGNAELHLRLTTTTTTGLVFVRITDVDADGHSHLVARGALNLTHRRGHAPEDVAPLVPGEFEDYVVSLKSTSYRFPAGHRLRVAVSTSYWPWLWPGPDVTSLRLDLAASSLSLPVLDTEAEALVDVDLGEPVIAPPPAVAMSGDQGSYWRTEREDDGTVTVRKGYTGASRVVFPEGWGVEYLVDGVVLSLKENDPLSASMERRIAQAYTGDRHRVLIEHETSMTATRGTFEVSIDSTVTLDGELVLREQSTRSVPRGL